MWLVVAELALEPASVGVGESAAAVLTAAAVLALVSAIRDAERDLVLLKRPVMP